ncbi:helix-turn-helix domain-containing protein [uncultured Clostridium sp.]|uniref:helix-turn-helix domain-containing protein n=1 Tax=uncultured Clostridium sp. TaxID=59620 RepID=UPI0025CC5308|nr:helix-turn-helix transcriptional regulator [uncultured Clostridium sp.]
MLGENIRKIRKAQKISINALSKITGISLGYLSDLENEKAKNPSLDKIKIIANALNCPLDELLSNVATNEDINTWDNEDSKKSQEIACDLSSLERDSDLKRIERARSKMTPKDKEKMMKVLEASFDEYFDD